MDTMAMISANGAHVHFVLPDGPESTHGECRPGFIVQDWGPHEGHHRVNLVVLHDGTNDSTDLNARLMSWRKRVDYSNRHEFGSWHWPSECRSNNPHGASSDLRTALGDVAVPLASPELQEVPDGAL